MVENKYRSIHILVVDDNAEIRQFLRETVLEPEGYRVTLAENGASGLAIALEEKPDLILLDYDMPRLDGIQVLEVLKEREIVIPVILITSYGSESIAVDVFRLGVMDYIPKPFSIGEILQAIERALYAFRLKQERDTLFEELQQANVQLTKRLKELDTLYHISKSVTSLREREKLLERVVDAALYITGAMDGMLVLLDPINGSPTTSVQRERQGKEYVASETNLNIHTGSLGLMLNVPLQIGDKVVGSLTVSNKRNREPVNQEDRRLLRMLADYAAIAIENFRLISGMEAQREREKRELRDLFKHYVSPAVAERILREPWSVQPGGQRQEIAVLFADLRGFNTFSATASPEALISVLNRHIASAAEMILSEEGTLNTFVGDEVMAFFNAPLPQDDYPLRAVRTAWRILQAIQQMHQELPVYQRLVYGIGVATGDAIVGNVGTQNLVNFTAVGHTVNVAHALQELAPAGKIIICHATYQAVKDQVQVQELPAVQIKGQQHPEPIYEVQWVEL